MIQFGIGKDGGLVLVFDRPVWEALKAAMQGTPPEAGGAAAAPEGAIESTEEFVKVNLTALAGKKFSITSISVLPRDEEPRCPPVKA